MIHLDARAAVRRAAVVLTTVAALGAAGCSGGSSTSAPTSAPAPTSSLPTTSSAEASPQASATSARPTRSSPSAGGTMSATSTPSAGSTASTVPDGTQPSNEPTKLASAKSTVSTGVTAELSGLRTAYVKARFPGEVSGNAVIFTVRVRNGTAKAVDVSNVVVTVLGANGDPASEITSAPADALSGSARPGSTVTGTYVFTVPKSQRRPITVQVTLSAQTSIAVFKGNVG